KAFHETFTHRPDPEPFAAFAALKAGGIPLRNLGYLTAPFRWDRRYELTFQMRADLTDPSLAQVEMLVETYQVLKDWKGKADVLANFLLGKGSEDAVWRRAADGRRRAEAAYVVAVRRLCGGAYREASDWFRVARELADENMGEYHWASNELRRWKEQSKTLDRIAPRCGTAQPESVEARAPQTVS